MRCAVSSCVPSASRRSYISRKYSFKGLFQLTSRAWMYFVQPPGTIVLSIFPLFRRYFTAGVKWHRKESQANSRRAPNVNTPNTSREYRSVSSSSTQPLTLVATEHFPLNSSFSHFTSRFPPLNTKKMASFWYHLLQQPNKQSLSTSLGQLVWSTKLNS